MWSRVPLFVGARSAFTGFLPLTSSRGFTASTRRSRSFPCSTDGLRRSYRPLLTKIWREKSRKKRLIVRCGVEASSTLIAIAAVAVVVVVVVVVVTQKDWPIKEPSRLSLLLLRWPRFDMVCSAASGPAAAPLTRRGWRVPGHPVRKASRRRAPLCATRTTELAHSLRSGSRSVFAVFPYGCVCFFFVSWFRPVWTDPGSRFKGFRTV